LLGDALVAHYGSSGSGVIAAAIQRDRVGLAVPRGPGIRAFTRQALPPGQARDRDQLTPFRAAAAGIK
jgi:hypothetical protein